MSYQAAITAGVDILDTAMSPFSMGTSQPPTESVVASLIGTPGDTGHRPPKTQGSPKYLYPNQGKICRVAQSYIRAC